MNGAGDNKTREFDLRALVRTVMREEDTTDMTVLAKAVRARIAQNDEGAALDQCLPAFVYDVARRGSGADSVATRTETAAKPSAKVRRIREEWRTRLEDRVCVATGTYKPYGDCTFDDLEHAAQLRFQLAEANRGAGRALRSLGQLLNDHDVATVRELPSQVLMEYFGARRVA